MNCSLFIPFREAPCWCGSYFVQRHRLEIFHSLCFPLEALPYFLLGSLLQGTCFKGRGNREGRMGWMGKRVKGRERGEVILS